MARSGSIPLSVVTLLSMYEVSFLCQAHFGHARVEGDFDEEYGGQGGALGQAAGDRDGGLGFSLDGHAHFLVAVEIRNGGYQFTRHPVLCHELYQALVHHPVESPVDVVCEDGGSGGIWAPRAFATLGGFEQLFMRQCEGHHKFSIADRPARHPKWSRELVAVSLHTYATLCIRIFWIVLVGQDQREMGRRFFRID